MPEDKNFAYRVIVKNERAKARRRDELQAREALRQVRIVSGVGLGSVLMGGVLGAVLAQSDLSMQSGTGLVAIPIVQAAADPTVLDISEGPLTLDTASGPRLEHSVAVPVAKPTPEVLPHPPGGGAPDAEQPTPKTADALDPIDLGGIAVIDEINLLEEAREAAYSRLYEEPPTESESGSKSLQQLPLDNMVIEPAAILVPDSPELEATELEGGELPSWRRFAVSVPKPTGQPMIAIVLDDLGLNRIQTRRAIDLPSPLTLAFMTYAPGLERLAQDAKTAGHELMLHVPMEPRNSSFDAGSEVLRTDLSAEEVQRRLDWGLNRFEGFVGINNHMGSHFTTVPGSMAQVMQTLRKRGLLFLDSLTSPRSVGTALAERMGVPNTRRDVFLDNEWNDPAAIARQFARLEAIALERGSAVGIGHPHRVTLDVLARWLPLARSRGFAIVPISAIVRYRHGIDQKVVATTG